MAIPSLSSLSSMIKTSADSSFGATTKKSHQAGAQASQTSVQISGISAKRQSALEMVDQVLAKAYEKMGLKVGGLQSSYSAAGPFTAEKVASNILGFIERRLVLDAAEGATQEQLASRLEAGLSGFKKGFAEAAEKIKALSMLSPEIEKDIGKTYDLVISGIDGLRQRFIEGVTAPKPEEAPKTDSVTKLDTSLTYQYRASSSFSFSLTTKDGDKVTINAAQAKDASLAVTGQSSHMMMAQSTSLSWSVEGDLSDEELSAIGSLIASIDDLATDFFAGNTQQSFEKALTLNYDKGQIASFALNLTSVEVQRVTAAYLPEKAPASEAAGLSETLLPLGQFIKKVYDIDNSLSQSPWLQQAMFAIAEQLPEKVETTNTLQPGQSFREFVETLLSAKTKA